MLPRGSGVASSALAAVAMLASAASAQRPSPATDPSAHHAPGERFAPPRTSWGDPDLQGTWPSDPDYPFRRPDDLTPYDRCISRGVLGSAFPNLYNTGLQIMQVPGLVAIRYEMIHETRLIPLDEVPHLGPALRSYMGDPRGHWDGNTLVVETTNFNGRTGSYGRNGNGNPTTDALSLVERFTLVDADTLQYRVTVRDPQTWVNPWSVAFSLTRDDAYALYEYACHEGNYAMANMLKGARAR